LGWGDAALLQMTLLPLAPLIAMLALDLSRTSCPVGPRKREALTEDGAPPHLADPCEPRGPLWVV
jgi:hypothetical protein